MKARIKSGTFNGDHLTIDKEYKVTSLVGGSPRTGKAFFIVDDLGDPAMCLEYNCAHLMGGEWELIEEPRNKGVLGFFRRLFGLNK